jgi:hypothetical protein
MKRLIRKILREEINKSDRHYKMLDKISDHVQLPYFKSMEGLTIYDKDDQLYIMKKILGDDIDWYETRFGLNIYNDNGSELYYEESDSDYWYKREYDDEGHLIYFERSDGKWVKREYDGNGNLTYVKTSDDL